MTGKLRSLRKYDAALLFAVLVWGVNMPVLKAALSAMPIHVINAFRFIISAVALGSLYLARRRGADFKNLHPWRTHGWQIVALGLLAYVAYQLFFIIGIDHTTAGNAALIMAGAPLWTAVLSRLFGYEYLSRMAWIGLTVTLTGTVMIILGGAHEIHFGDSTFLGNLLMLVASILWGSYTAFSRPVVQKIPPFVLNFLGILVALPVLLVIAAPDFDQVIWEKVDLWVWGAIVFSGGLSTGLTFVIWTTAVREVGPSHTAVYGNLVPFVALVSSYLVLNETIHAAQIAGGVLIVSGLVFTRRSPGSKAKTIPFPTKQSDSYHLES